MDLLAKVLAIVPPWVRIYRIQRDIPMPLVTSGVEYGNLRELVLARMKDFGTVSSKKNKTESLTYALFLDQPYKCRDVRTREVGIQEVHHKVKVENVELVRRDYVANGGWETFLSYEDPKQDIRRPPLPLTYFIFSYFVFYIDSFLLFLLFYGIDTCNIY